MTLTGIKRSLVGPWYPCRMLTKRYLCQRLIHTQRQVGWLLRLTLSIYGYLLCPRGSPLHSGICRTELILGVFQNLAAWRTCVSLVSNHEKRLPYCGRATCLKTSFTCPCRAAKREQRKIGMTNLYLAHNPYHLSSRSSDLFVQAAWSETRRRRTERRQYRRTALLLEVHDPNSLLVAPMVALCCCPRDASRYLSCTRPM